MTIFPDVRCLSLPVRPLVVVLAMLAWGEWANSQSATAAVTTPPTAENKAQPPAESKAEAPAENKAEAPLVGDMYIREYRVRGSRLLNGAEIGEVVYPFLGPGRTTVDIDNARAALEKAYHDKGYQTVSVSIPPQSGWRGLVFLQVEEMKVGKLLVKGSRYYLPSDIKKRAPSMAPGTVPDFNQVQKDIVALNKSENLQVTPVLSPGEEPGTVDFELTVKDKAPLHGSIELNNRYSPHTVPLRLNGSINYDNLWQLGHTLGFSFQIAPERIIDGEVYSAFYTVPLSQDVNFTVQGTSQKSDVASLTGTDSIGQGDIIGGRVNWTLPEGKDFLHSFTLGLDYKHMVDRTRTYTVVQGKRVLGTFTLVDTPIDYYPMSLAYSASWVKKSNFTDLNAAMNMHFRGMGSDQDKFDGKRYNADGSYVYFRGDLTHTHDLPGGMEVMAKVQGQLANHPLVNSEQFAAGGQSTVRGYLESEALGDNGVVGTLELRSPSFIGTKKEGTKTQDNEWRVYAFLEGGTLSLNDPLPEQTSRFDLASVGIGTHLKLHEHFNGSLDVSMPLIDQGTTLGGDLFLSFRIWADF